MKTYKSVLFFLVILLLFSYTGNAQWVQMSNGIGNDKLVSSLITSDNNIVAGTSCCGVFISTNNGEIWIQMLLNNHNVISLTIINNNFFAGVETNCNNSSGVYRSTNYGTNWSQTTFTSRSILSLTSKGVLLFAGSWTCVNQGGVHISTDYGLSWNPTSLCFDTIDVCSIYANGNDIFAGFANSVINCSGGLYVSSDNGNSWSYSGLVFKSIRALAFNGNYIYAGTNGAGVYLSTNYGLNWTQTTLNNQIVQTIVISGNNIFAGTESGGIYFSSNNGTIWIPKNQGLESANIKSLLIKDNYLFAGTSGKSIYRRNLSEIIGIKKISEEIPDNYLLEQNFPNPFNPSTNIKYHISKTCFVKLKVYDALGKEIETIVSEIQTPGTYEVIYDASNYSCGVYYYSLITEDYKQVKKMVLIK